MLTVKKMLCALAFVASLMLGMQALSQSASAEGKGSMYEKKSQTVEEVKNLSNGAYVVLEGYIVEKHGDEKYTFKDDSGTIVVDISDEDWGGKVPTSEEIIEIEGELEKEPGKLKIDVDRVTRK